MVMPHHGVSSYMTGGDRYSISHRPVTAGGDPILHRYHSGVDEGWKPIPKKNNVALSALVLLSFLFFLNILQNCVDDHMKEKHNHHGHNQANVSYQWPVWQVSARSNLQTPKTQTLGQADEQSQEYSSYDSIEDENTEGTPIERFLPEFHQIKTRINSKKPETSNVQSGVLMEKLMPVFEPKN